MKAINRLAISNFLLAFSTTVGMTIIPIICTSSIGMSLFVLGVLEGSCELLSNILKVSSGIIFDKVKNIRILFVLSSILSLLSKAVLFVSTPFSMIFSKNAERISNGLFSTPRDAFAASISKGKGKEISRMAMYKSVGCVLGPLFVAASSYFFGGIEMSITPLISVCVLCSLASAFLCSGINLERQDRKKEHDIKKINKYPANKNVFYVLSLSFLFFLGRFNDGLIMIHMRNLGVNDFICLSFIGVFNFVMIFSAPIIGKMCDKGKSDRAMIVSVLSLILFCFLFNFVHIHLIVVPLVSLALWGAQRVSSQITFTSMIANNVKKENIGMYIGVFSILSGLGTFLSSYIAGFVANSGGNFLFMPAMSGLSCFFLFLFARKKIML